MGTVIVAVLGTLGGAVTASLIQYVTAVRVQRAAETERRRDALAATAPVFLAALVDHRRHQYLKIAARREGHPDTPEAREARYEARSAVTAARGALRMATRDRRLLDLATVAVDTAFALGDAVDDAAVEAAGDAARAAHDALEEAAATAVHRFPA